MTNKFPILVALLAAVGACKPRVNNTAALRADSDPSNGVDSGLKDFSLEPTGQFARKLGARLAAADVPAAGCAHAARYTVAAAPGRTKTSWTQYRGDLVESLRSAANSQMLSWDNLEYWVTLPTYAFMACKGSTDYPKVDEAPRELLGTLKERARHPSGRIARPRAPKATARSPRSRSRWRWCSAVRRRRCVARSRGRERGRG